MRVLFLALEPPYPPNDGGRIRTFELLRQLAPHCQITLLAFESTKQPDTDWSPLREVCHEVHVIARPVRERPTIRERLHFLGQRLPQAIRLYDSAGMTDLVERSLAGGRYDMLHVNDLYLARYAGLAPQMPRIMDHTDVEAHKQRRLLLTDPLRFTPYWFLRWVEHWQWQGFERQSLTWFAAHTVVSNPDASYFRCHARGTPVFVIPNGVSGAKIIPRPDPVGVPTLLYVGSMDYLPNSEAVLKFVRHTWPLIRQAVPHVRLLVVGRNPPPAVQRLAQEPEIVVTGTVADVRPYHEEAHGLVVPLESGGGTRLKILEALAAGVPVVSTAVGVEGLELQPEMDFLLADNHRTFAQQTTRLLGDRNLREALAVHGRQAVTSRYDWAVIGDGLLQVYEKTIAIWQDRRRSVRMGSVVVTP